MKSRYAKLRETNELVTRRLDAAIGQIRNIVDG